MTKLEHRICNRVIKVLMQSRPTHVYEYVVSNKKPVLHARSKTGQYSVHITDLVNAYKEWIKDPSCISDYVGKDLGPSDKDLKTIIEDFLCNGEPTV